MRRPNCNRLHRRVVLDILFGCDTGWLPVPARIPVEPRVPRLHLPAGRRRIMVNLVVMIHFKHVRIRNWDASRLRHKLGLRIRMHLIVVEYRSLTETHRPRSLTPAVANFFRINHAQPLVAQSLRNVVCPPNPCSLDGNLARESKELDLTSWFFAVGLDLSVEGLMGTLPEPKGIHAGRVRRRLPGWHRVAVARFCLEESRLQHGVHRHVGAIVRYAAAISPRIPSSHGVQTVYQHQRFGASEAMRVPKEDLTGSGLHRVPRNTLVVAYAVLQRPVPEQVVAKLRQRMFDNADVHSGVRCERVSPSVCHAQAESEFGVLQWRGKRW